MPQLRGFTLVELVVVILILGILAAIAAPKIFGVGGQATDNGLRQTLSVIRDAINIYSAEHGGELPGADGNSGNFKSDLRAYIRASFPVGPVGPTKGDSRVRMVNDGDPLEGRPFPARTWRYDYTTGQFILNYNGISNDGITLYDTF